MFSLNRFNSKELALAYVNSQQQSLSPTEFLQAVTRAEAEFSQLLNASCRPVGLTQPACAFRD